MTKKLISLIILAFGFLLSAYGRIAHAAAPAPTPTPFSEAKPELIERNQASPLNTSLRFEQLSIEDGLSQSVITSVLQDQFGFIWIGTQDGLNRYDGNTFTIYRPDPNDPGAIKDRWISSLYEDKEGYIWVGTYFGGLNRYDPYDNTFTQFLNDPNNPTSISSNRINAILEDSHGNLWVGTNKGLDLLDRSTGEFGHFKSTSDLPDSISGNNITVLFEDSHDVLWVGTTQDGLNRYDRQTSTFNSFRFGPWESLGHNKINAIEEETPEKLWIATDQGILLFDIGNNTFVRYHHISWDATSLVNNSATSLYKDDSGTLWVGTESGLDLFQPETRNFVHYKYSSNNPTSLGNNHIMTIYKDQGGIMWFGTFGGGLNIYNSHQRQFIYYRHEENNKNSLSSNLIFPIHAAEDGMIWIGTEDAGMNRFDPALERFTHYRHIERNLGSLLSNDVNAILVDHAKTLWVGTSEGLSSLADGASNFIHYLPEDGNPNSLLSKNIYALYEDSKNTLWIGTNSGLTQFNPRTGTFTHHRASASKPYTISNNAITTIYEDHKGYLWVGTYFGGVNRYDPKTNKFIHFKHDSQKPDSLTHNLIMAVYEDSLHRIWVATSGGLNLFHPETGTFTHYLQKDGLPNDFVYGILEDDAGNLWLSTNFGLSRFNPDEHTFRNYTASDGLQSNEFNMNAYAKDANGNMYFGGINGITTFHPSEISDHDYLPPIKLTNFLLDDESLSGQPQSHLMKEIKLNWPQNSFAFEFSSLGYAQPARNQHAYMLENFDDDWNYIGTRRAGRYTNLPGGTYTLHLKGTNSDGVWNENGQSIRITIVPPFWQKTPFRVIATLLIIGLGVVAYRLRMKNIQVKNQNLEKLVDERTSSLQKRTEELEALYSGNEKIVRAMTLEHIFHALIEVAANTLHANRSAIFVWDEHKENLVPHISRGFLPETLENLSFAKDEGLVGQVLSDGQTLVISNLETNLLKPKTRSAVVSEGIQSLIHIPIKVDGQIEGVFNVCFTQPDAATEDTVRLYTMLVQRAELSLENMRLFEKTKEVAVIEERNRVARELHDSAKQKAFAALAQLGAVNGILDHNIPNARIHLLEAENLVYDVLQELTFLIQEMYPLALQEKGLVNVLDDYIFEWKNRNDIVAELHIKNTIAMELESEQAIYRMIQEALANIARHSKAKHVNISLNFDKDSLFVTVEDDGQGFDSDQNPNGMGLRTIIERAEQIGGQAAIRSQIGLGTVVQIEIPIVKNA